MPVLGCAQMTRVIALFFFAFVVSGASAVEACRQLETPLEVQLFVFPDCTSAATVVNNVIDVVNRFVANSSSPVSFTLTPIACGKDKRSQCKLVRSGGRFREMDRDDFSIRHWGSAAICLQLSERHTSRRKLQLQRCLVANFTTAEQVNYCGTSFGTYSKTASPDANLRSCIAFHHRQVNKAWADSVRSGVVTAPTLLINRRLYCGSYSHQDLEEAFCAASPSSAQETFGRSACNIWWNSSDGALDMANTCRVETSRGTSRFMEALAIICFIMVSSTFLFMVLSRRRLDAMLSQQRRREASGQRIHELLSILATSRNQPTMPRRSSAEVNNALAQLPIKEYVQKQRDPAGSGGTASAADSTCTICLEAMNAGDEYYDLESCGHVYHKECLKQWLGKKNECPICRRSILELPEASASNDVGIELRNVSRRNVNGVERVINFTTANGANVTISVSSNSQVALSMT